MNDDRKARSDRPLRSTVMPHMDSDEDDSPKKRSSKKSRKTKLELDEEHLRPSRTRTSLYNELAEKERVLTEEDYYEMPSHFRRGMSFAIDLIFLYGLWMLVEAALPVEFKVLAAILDMYKLAFPFEKTTMLNMIMIANILFCLFFFVIVPTAFFNTSLGKKITGQRVRGDDKYTLSITQAFQREIIWKPIGIACLASFILPFFDKKKKSLHDKLSKTFLVDD